MTLNLKASNTLAKFSARSGESDPLPPFTIVGNGSNAARSRQFSTAAELDFLSVAVTAKTTLQQCQCIYL
jgi:hypothetical protein